MDGFPLPCSNALEDPWVEPSETMFTRSVSPEQAPDEPTYIEVEFEKGDPVAIDGVKMSPATLLTKLNELGGKNGGCGCAHGGLVVIFRAVGL